MGAKRDDIWEDYEIRRMIEASPIFADRIPLSTDLCARCGDVGHTRADHAALGPKKPHQKSCLYSKQLSGEINWKVWPETNGPYTLFPTSENAFCEVALCSCIDFEEPK